MIDLAELPPNVVILATLRFDDETWYCASGMCVKVKEDNRFPPLKREWFGTIWSENGTP